MKWALVAAILVLVGCAQPTPTPQPTATPTAPPDADPDCHPYPQPDVDSNRYSYPHADTSSAPAVRGPNPGKLNRNARTHNPYACPDSGSLHVHAGRESYTLTHPSASPERGPGGIPRGLPGEV